MIEKIIKLNNWIHVEPKEKIIDGACGWCKNKLSSLELEIETRRLGIFGTFHFGQSALTWWASGWNADVPSSNPLYKILL